MASIDARPVGSLTFLVGGTSFFFCPVALPLAAGPDFDPALAFGVAALLASGAYLTSSSNSDARTKGTTARPLGEPRAPWGSFARQKREARQWPP